LLHSNPTTHKRPVYRNGLPVSTCSLFQHKMRLKKGVISNTR